MLIINMHDVMYGQYWCMRQTLMEAFIIKIHGGGFIYIDK